MPPNKCEIIKKHNIKIDRPSKKTAKNISQIKMIRKKSYFITSYFMHYYFKRSLNSSSLEKLKQIVMHIISFIYLQQINNQMNMSMSMKALLLVMLAVCALSMKLRQSHEQGDNDLIVGGYSKVSVNNLSQNQKQIDQYLRTTYPQINGLTLTEAQTQVVAGTNYKYTYKGSDGTAYEFVVYDRSWEKVRQVTSAKRTKSYVNNLGQTVTAVKTVSSNTGAFNSAVNQLFQ